MKLTYILVCLGFFLLPLFAGAQVSSVIADLERQKAKAVEEGNFRLAGEIKQKIQAQKEKEQLEKEEKKKAEMAKSGGPMVNSKEIEALEKQKKEAVANYDFALAQQLQGKIKALKEKEAMQKPQAGTASQPDELEKLEKQKKEAVANQDFLLANEIQKKIKAIKEGQGTGTATATASNRNPAIEKEIEFLEKEKKEAIADANYKLAGEINSRIKQLKESPSSSAPPLASGNSAVQAQIKALELEKAKAVEMADYKKAGQINAQIKNLKDPKPSTPATTANYNTAAAAPVLNNPNIRISKSGENDMAGIRYRRSSLYLLIKDDPARPHANVINRTFVNSPVPEKFNDHGLATRIFSHTGAQVPTNPAVGGGSMTALAAAALGNASLASLPAGNSVSTTQNELNRIAREMVAKWFNRDEYGRFNMDLIAQRGAYNASNIDFNIAQSSARGMALLADAGEELISNTFVVINEFHYTNKEEVAKKANTGLRILSTVADAAGYSTVSTVANVAVVGTTVAGKGYVVKNKSHLYQLVWNEEIAAIFYRDYWMDDSNYDENRKQAFDNSNLFQLRYIGYENAWQDLQSSIFTNKTEEQLIAKATTKAIDAGIAKLQRKFEQFRTKTPLYSVDPLAAKIGLKEGLKAGDKFEVLEQVQDADGKIKYVRKGIIYVDGKQIWDNTYTMEELHEMGKTGQQENQFTLFRGGTGYAPGMLIRQIN